MSNNQIATEKESRLRSVLKGISWRIIASGAIFVIAYFYTGEIDTAIGVTSIEFFVKLLLYYLHERAWQNVPRGSVRKFFQKNKSE